MILSCGTVWDQHLNFVKLFGIHQNIREQTVCVTNKFKLFEFFRILLQPSTILIRSCIQEVSLKSYHLYGNLFYLMSILVIL